MTDHSATVDAAVAVVVVTSHVQWVVEFAVDRDVVPVAAAAACDFHCLVYASAAIVAAAAAVTLASEDPLAIVDSTASVDAVVPDTMLVGIPWQQN